MEIVVGASWATQRKMRGEMKMEMKKWSMCTTMGTTGPLTSTRSNSSSLSGGFLSAAADVISLPKRFVDGVSSWLCSLIEGDTA